MSWLSDIFGGIGEVRKAVREGAVIVDLWTGFAAILTGSTVPASP